jgi:malonyl-CoA O-methyltransferase
LDLGCGSGAIYKLIGKDAKKFVGVDSSASMLSLHPKAKNVILKNLDFEDESCFDATYSLIISSSSLQWAKDIDKVFEKIKKYGKNIALGIFTSGTFKSLHEVAKLKPLLLSKEEIIFFANKRFDNPKIEHIEYRLEFESKKDIFEYIKKSGVSGGKKRLSFKEAKSLLKSYDKNYLEFEVVFIHKM